MQWIKEFLIACVIILAFFASWAISVQIGDLPWVFGYGHEWLAVGIGLLLAAVGAAGYFLLPDNFKLIGAGVGLGAVIGVFFPLTLLVVSWFENVRNFWGCLGVWFVYVIIEGVAMALFVCAVKNLIFSVFRLDFLVTLLSLVVGVTAFFAGIWIVVAAFNLSTWVGIGVLISLCGGFAGSGAPAISSEEFMVSDGRGGYHFTVGTSAGGYKIDTDGNTLRRRSDGTYEKIH